MLTANVLKQKRNARLMDANGFRFVYGHLQNGGQIIKYPFGYYTYLKLAWVGLTVENMAKESIPNSVLVAISAVAIVWKRGTA
jgi:hypothetical protein